MAGWIDRSSIDANNTPRTQHSYRLIHRMHTCTLPSVTDTKTLDAPLSLCVSGACPGESSGIPPGTNCAVGYSAGWEEDQRLSVGKRQKRKLSLCCSHDLLRFTCNRELLLCKAIMNLPAKLPGILHCPTRLVYAIEHCPPPPPPGLLPILAVQHTPCCRIPPPLSPLHSLSASIIPLGYGGNRLSLSASVLYCCE